MLSLLGLLVRSRQETRSEVGFSWPATFLCRSNKATRHIPGKLNSEPTFVLNKIQKLRFLQLLCVSSFILICQSHAALQQVTWQAPQTSKSKQSLKGLNFLKKHFLLRADLQSHSTTGCRITIVAIFSTNVSRDNQIFAETGASRLTVTKGSRRFN